MTREKVSEVFYLLFSILLLNAQERVYYSDEVVVMGSREEEGFLSNPAPVYSTALLDYLNIYSSNISDLTLVSPSVRLNINPKKNEIRPSFRGLPGENGTVFINGVAFGNPWDNTFLLNEMSNGMVSRVEFYPSGGVLSTPSEGIGGVINIIPRRAKKSLELETLIQAGSYGWRNARVLCGGMFGKGEIIMSGSSTNYDGYLKNTDFKSYDLSGNTNYRAGRYGNIGFFTTFHTSEKSAWGPRPGEFLRFPFYQTFLTNLSHEVEIGSRLNLVSRVFFSRWDNLLIAYSDSSMTTEKYRSLHHNRDIGGELISNLVLSPKAVFSFGGTGKERKMSTTNEGEKSVGRGQGFIRGFFRVHPRVSLLVGSRANFSDDFSWRLDYESGTTFLLHDKLRLKIHLSHLTGFPSLRQLYNENPDETDHSNKNLKPTISKNYETTVQYDPTPMMRIMVTAFYTRAQDLVGTVRLPPPTRFRFENITSARLTGIEIFAKGKVNNFISFFVTYAYNDSRDLSTSEPLEHSVYNRGGAGVNLSFWRFKPIVLLEFRSKEIIRESSGNMGYLKGYSKLDTGLEFTMWRNNSVFVYIENVTDKIYFIAENMEGEPRSIRAGLNISY